MSFNVRFLRQIALALAGWFLLPCSMTLAQKAPELGYVFPPVVRAGTTTVQLGGYDVTPDLEYFVHHPTIKLEVSGPPGDFLVPGPPYWFGEKARSTAFPIPREATARLTVPADTPAGVVRWQVANANGSSGTALFYVSDGPEMVEKRLRDEPPPLPSLPMSVSGRIEKITEVDRYTFKASQDGPITIDLMARRLGSDFHGLLEVWDDRGQVLASVADTEGLDPTLTFTARKGLAYEVRVHDIDFRGNRAFVYRLTVTPQPHVLATLPAHGRRGSTGEVTFVGQGIATGKAQMETLRRQVSFPKDASISSFQYRLETSSGIVPVIIPLSDVEEVTEPSRQDNPVPKLLAPGAVTGTLSENAQQDRYIFRSAKGQEWKITLQSRAIGTHLDVELQILGPDGKSLAVIDDSGTADAETNFKAPAEGEYTCVIRDLSGHDGNVAAVYRLAITQPEPDYSLSAPQQINVPIGGKAQVPIKVQRLGGFTGPITLRVEGLPEGITCDPTLTVPADKNAFNVTLTCDKNAATHAARLRITGQAKVGDQQVIRVASAPAEGSLCPRSPMENQSTYLLLAVTMQPPFSVELIDRNRQRAVHRGTTYPAEFLIKREEGCTGEVLLQMAARQGRHRQGIHGPIITVAPKEERALYPCFMPEWLETDRTTRMAVLGVARVLDPQGKPRYLTKPADARVTMILEGALLKLSHHAPELTVQPGEAFEVTLEVARSAKLPREVRLELVGPSEVIDVLRAKSLTLGPAESRAVLRIQTSADERLQGDWTLTIKATAMQEDRWPVVSQTEVRVRFAPVSR